MINFNLSPRKEVDDINSIIDEKNRGTKKTELLKLKSKIIKRYGDHIAIESFKRLANETYSDVEKEALQSLYSSQTITAKEITRQVLNNLDANKYDTCLYCGIGEIDQLDHFLPKEFFPEFSILHKNLIPICGKCNEIKGSKIPGKDGFDFLHVIFDILPIESYLRCNITYGDSIPLVSFSVQNKFKGNVLNSHFNSLKLEKRLEKKATQYFLQIRALKNEYSVKYAEEELKRDLINTRFFFNDFFWKAELIDTMIKTDYVNKIE